MTGQHDLIIVGGGPAGLTAGLYASRSRLKTLLLEKMGPGGQLLNTELIEDYPGFRSITGFELAQRMEEQAREFGTEIEYGTVAEIWSEGTEKVVRTEEGEEYRAGAVIVCTGGSPRQLGAPGEAELAGRGVSYCAICDGAFFKGQDIAVVGGGDAAIEEATFLTRYGRKVYLIHRRDQFRAQRLLVERALAQPNLEPVLNATVERIGGDDRVEWVELRKVADGSISRLPVQATFIYVGFAPNSSMFRDPVERDAGGFIVTNDRMETSIPGIYAAGDIRSQLVRQITNAVGDATTAAIAAMRYIEALHDLARKPG